MKNLAVVGKDEIQSVLQLFDDSPKTHISGKGMVWRTLNRSFGDSATIGDVISIVNSEPAIKSELSELHEGFSSNVQ